MKRIKVEDSVGLVLAYDITEINQNKGKKGRAFKRGHIIKEDDIEYMKNLGRKHIFVEDGNTCDVHEDEVAMTVAPLIAGENIIFDSEPSEGKIGFYADCDGLFKIDVERQYQINLLGIPSLPSINTDFPVKKGMSVAAFRIIPLTCEEEIVLKIKENLKEPLLKVIPYIKTKIGIIVTGSEIYEGRVEDAFIPGMKKKLKTYDLQIEESVILPDVKEKIIAKINEYSMKFDIVFISGGTSVDPDDITSIAMREAGVNFEVKGNPVQPGNNFTIGYLKDTVVCAVPAAAVFYKSTALDVFLPKILVGEKITKEMIARAGHGGLCHFCKVCHFPVCPFGRFV